MLTLEEILDALGPCWRFANETTEDGTFVRPDYRRALDEAWTDIVVAAEGKRSRELPAPHPTLNVAMVRRHDDECEQRPGGEYHGRTIGSPPMTIPCHCEARRSGRARAERERR